MGAAIVQVEATRETRAIVSTPPAGGGRISFFALCQGFPATTLDEIVGMEAWERRLGGRFIISNILHRARETE